ncbi:MAG: hypothetical protein Q9222_007392, partial [Ikaeria aurantiellina]
MAANPFDYWTTTLLVRNIHCSSCQSYIKNIFAVFETDIHEITVNVPRQSIEIRHEKSLGSRKICTALAEAAFDVASALTRDERGQPVEDLAFDDQDGWCELLGSWSRPKYLRSPLPRMKTTQNARQLHHIQNCASCKGDQVPVTSSRKHVTSDIDASTSPQSNAMVPSTSGQTPPPPTSIKLSVSGMTCASCSKGITDALLQHDYVTKADVSHMTNSAVVEFNGSAEKVGLIVNVIEEAGFDASVLTDAANNAIAADFDTTQRHITLSINGMFCKHCPPKVIEALKSRFSSRINIEQAPSLEDPMVKVSYDPVASSLTIRDIIATVDGVHEHFKARVYHPPSMEDLSQSMQAQERLKILWRLALSAVLAVPTFLIGVVWMSLVPAENAMRTYIETKIGPGTVTLAQWCLFGLATPVMFFAADVFHRRAIKEVYALWRPKSQTPILRRFYRFGSMSLLVSAGTSVAYLSSLALLIMNIKTSPEQPGQSTTYFDAVVFLTFFILTGKFLEAYSKSKTGSAIAMLGKLRPQEAILINLPFGADNRSVSPESSTSSKEDATIETTTQTINLDLLEIGDVVLVKRGSSPPADGVIVSGVSNFNESSLTGESRDVTKSEGDQVFAGTVNNGDSIHIKVTGLGGMSMLDQIISVVRDGQTKRAPVERIVDAVTGYFVPVITALAIITFFVWFTLGESGRLDPKYLKDHEGGWAFWSLEFAIAVFVVACPCGIGLAAPTALFVGGGLAAKSGILVRGGGEAFQEASKVDAVVFDKTGTLTEGGNPTVTDNEMLVEGDLRDIAWSITQALEETSSHPLARAILQCASEHASSATEVTASGAITEEPGLGLRGSFTSPDNTTYEAALGSELLISSLQPPLPLSYYHTTTLSTWKSQSKSIALLAIRPSSPNPTTTDEQPWILTTLFALSSPLRPSAIPTISHLQNNLKIPVYMLTGDNPQTASAVASTLSIPATHVFASCLPTQKAAKIEWLKDNAPLRDLTSSSSMARFLGYCTRGRKQKPRRKAIIAFVGDGINDAPALATANVSISISSSGAGAGGSGGGGGAADIALHSSSFILLSGNLG